MKFKTLGTIALVAMGLSTARPALSQTTNLNAQLQQAICTQNWGVAINVVDRMIALTPTGNQAQQGHLVVYRGQLLALQESRAVVPKASDDCSATPSASTVVASNPSTDKAFINAFKEMAGDESVPIKRFLLGRIQKYPQQEISYAKIICSKLKAGNTMANIMDSQFHSVMSSRNSAVDEAALSRIAIINELAVEYYCPGLSGR